jgi:ComF family protein
MLAAFKQIGRSLGELVFPPACAGCDATIAPAQGDWCLRCASKLLAITSKTYCPRCGMAVGEFLFDHGGCPNCRTTRIRPAGFVRVGTYHDLVGETLRRFKFNREHRLDATLGRLLAAALTGQPWHRELDALVPVPTNSWGRLRYRGWPVWMIAAQAGRSLQIPTLPLLLTANKRRRQVGLPQKERQRNIRDAFRVDRHARIQGARLCVIDDVSTTGSTIHEITRLLLEGGAEQVYAAVLAKTDPNRDDADPL